jgi:hypothetical protein
MTLDVQRFVRRLGVVPGSTGIGVAVDDAAGSYRAVIEEIGALWLPDASGLRSALDLLLASRGNGRHR